MAAIITDSKDSKRPKISNGNIPFAINIDEDAVALSNWVENGGQLSPPQCNVPGLVFVAEWGYATSENILPKYEKLRQQTIEATNGTLFCYPPFSSHITIATLSSFKKIDSPRSFFTKEEDDLYIKTWIDGIQKVLLEEEETNNGGKMKSFEVEAYCIEVSPGAAFIKFNDDINKQGILKLRELIEKVRDSDPAIHELHDKYYAKYGTQIKSSVHIPDIIHSSFGRFVKIPETSAITLSSSLSSSTTTTSAMERNISPLSTENFKEKFDEMALKSFQSFKVQIRNLTLANETSPYMHQSQKEESLFTFELQN